MFCSCNCLFCHLVFLTPNADLLHPTLGGGSSCTQIKKRAVINLAMTVWVSGLSHPIFLINTISSPPWAETWFLWKWHLPTYFIFVGDYISYFSAAHLKHHGHKQLMGQRVYSGLQLQRERTYCWGGLAAGCQSRKLRNHISSPEGTEVG